MTEWTTIWDCADLVVRRLRQLYHLLAVPVVHRLAARSREVWHASIAGWLSCVRVLHPLLTGVRWT